MKTLVFFGSARANGHTKQLLNSLLDNLSGEVEIIDAYNTTVSPCKDCRYCWHKKGCSIKDNMQEIYQKVEDADNVIFAAPMYFHSVPGPLKTIIDRLQIYWSSHVRKDKPESPLRNGAIIMVGGAPGFEIQFDAGKQMLTSVLNDIDSTCLDVICMENTDVDSIQERSDIEEKLVSLANKFNEINKI